MRNSPSSLTETPAKMPLSQLIARMHICFYRTGTTPLPTTAELRRAACSGINSHQMQYDDLLQG